MISEGYSGFSSNSLSSKYNKSLKNYNKSLLQTNRKKRKENIERFKDRGVSGHAETVAIKKCKSHKGNTIVIARIKDNGKMGMAKPCITCIQAIKFTNIKHIWYTTENGWKYENIKDIIGEYSSGTRRSYCNHTNNK